MQTIDETIEKDVGIKHSLQMALCNKLKTINTMFGFNLSIEVHNGQELDHGVYVKVMIRALIDYWDVKDLTTRDYERARPTTAGGYFGAHNALGPVERAHIVREFTDLHRMQTLENQQRAIYVNDFYSLIIKIENMRKRNHWGSESVFKHYVAKMLNILLYINLTKYVSISLVVLVMSRIINDSKNSSYDVLVLIEKLESSSGALASVASVRQIARRLVKLSKTHSLLDVAHPEKGLMELKTSCVQRLRTANYSPTGYNYMAEDGYTSIYALAQNREPSQPYFHPGRRLERITGLYLEKQHKESVPTELICCLSIILVTELSAFHTAYNRPNETWSSRMQAEHFVNYFKGVKNKYLPLKEFGPYSCYRRGLITDDAAHTIVYLKVIKDLKGKVNKCDVGEVRGFNRKKDKLNPFQTSIKELTKLLGYVNHVAPDLYLPSVNLLRMFGSAETATRFIEASGLNLHDAGQFTLPKGFEVKQEWRHIFIQAPYLTRYASLMKKVEKKLKRAPTSVSEFREIVAQVSPSISGYEQLIKYGGSDEVVQDYMTFTRNNKCKSFQSVPAPGGLEGIWHDGLHLKQLEHNDPAQIYAGVLTDCCQHLHGMADTAAKAVWKSGHLAIWGVYKDGEMVAQAMVWRSTAKHGGVGECLVLDSIETNNDFDGDKLEIFVKAAESVLGVLGIDTVLEGEESGYLNLNFGSVETPKRPGSIKFYSDCDDSARIIATRIPKERIEFYVDHRTGKGYRSVQFDGVNGVTYFGTPVLLPPQFEGMPNTPETLQMLEGYLETEAREITVSQGYNHVGEVFYPTIVVTPDNINPPVTDFPHNPAI